MSVVVTVYSCAVLTVKVRWNQNAKCLHFISSGQARPCTAPSIGFVKYSLRRHISATHQNAKFIFANSPFWQTLADGQSAHLRTLIWGWAQDVDLTSRLRDVLKEGADLLPGQRQQSISVKETCSAAVTEVLWEVYLIWRSKARWVSPLSPKMPK